MEKFRDKKKDLHIVFIDFGNACDKVLKEIIDGFWKGKKKSIK